MMSLQVSVKIECMGVGRTLTKNEIAELCKGVHCVDLDESFHFSVSLHVPFSQFLFKRYSYSNAYLLAKFGFDTAENEPRKV